MSAFKALREASQLFDRIMVEELSPEPKPAEVAPEISQEDLVPTPHRR
jgi:hypothetical protein